MVRTRRWCKASRRSWPSCHLPGQLNLLSALARILAKRVQEGDSVALRLALNYVFGPPMDVAGAELLARIEALETQGVA